MYPAAITGKQLVFMYTHGPVHYVGFMLTEKLLSRIDIRYHTCTLPILLNNLIVDALC